MPLTNKPRICFVGNAADIHVQRWSKYFADNGYQVHIISRYPSSEIPEYITLHVLKPYGVKIKGLKYLITPLSILIQISRLLKTIKPDAVHCFGAEFYTIITALAGFHPLLIWPWGTDVLIDPKESVIMRYCVPFALKRADIIIYDGENMREAVVKMGVPAEKFEKILQGVDVNKFKNFKRDTKLREELKLDDSPTVISTRRFGPSHDIVTIAEAIPLVLKHIPEAKFVFVGEGEQKESVVAKIKALKVLDATRFVGRVQNDDLPRYLSSSDVHVSTSVSDSGLSIATAEAMVCELPVIVTDFGDNRSWVEDGVNGFAIPPRDHHSLAKNIVYLLENEKIREEFGKRNKKIIEERNNYHIEMKKMDGIYRELIVKHKGPSKNTCG
ncbi:glycosyltransferase family 4 protein [Chloroflexota bacterium]